MKVKYQNHEKRKNRAQAFWRQVLKDYNGGKSAQAIANFYVNPKTGKNYTRAHIYWILEKMLQIDPETQKV
jgi:hypothetical protein